MKRASRTAAVVTALASSLVVGSAASAATVLSYTGGTAAPRNAGTINIGNEFQVGSQNLTVSALGAQDDTTTGPGTDGFAGGSIKVGIWNDAGTTLLASVTVLSSDTLGTGDYRYHTLTTPLTLTAGTKYLIGALVVSPDRFEDRNSSPPAFVSGDSNITLLQNRFASGPSFAAPTSNGAGTLGRWGEANAIFTVATAVPTPAELPAGLVLLGLTAFRRRRG